MKFNNRGGDGGWSVGLSPYVISSNFNSYNNLLSIEVDTNVVSVLEMRKMSICLKSHS